MRASSLKTSTTPLPCCKEHGLVVVSFLQRSGLVRRVAKLLSWGEQFFARTTVYERLPSAWS
jgi:hypothetical protein